MFKRKTDATQEKMKPGTRAVAVDDLQKQTPYVGHPVRIHNGKEEISKHHAITGPHVLVSGPSGVGKSRRVLGPGILVWQGPVVAVSSKPDLVELCLDKRVELGGAGRTYIIDLSGEIPDDQVPEGAEKVYVDPVSLVNTADDALEMATILMEAGAAGAGGGSTSGGDSFWESVSTGPLAALIMAASILDEGIQWVRDAVSLVAQELGDDETEATVKLQPSWKLAVVTLEDNYEMTLASKLQAAIMRDEKMRDSIGITMESALSPWMKSTVFGNGTRPFTPALLEHTHASLFMVAPATGVAAGAAVGVVDFISKRWRANQTEEVKLPRVLLVVDELCNTLPWAKLPTVVTEARAMGVNLLVAVQSTSQLARRYGTDGMTELREVFPSVLLLRGAPEKQMVEDAAWWDGEQDEPRITIDHQGNKSQSYEKVPRTRPQELLPTDIDHGRLLRGTAVGEPMKQSGVMVRLTDIGSMNFIAG